MTTATPMRDHSQNPRADTRSRADEIGQRQSRNDQPGLDHLRLKGESDPDTCEQQVAETSGHERRDDRVRREHEQQYQERVGDVPPVECDGRRGYREYPCGGDRRSRSREPSYGAVQDEHRQDSLHRLGKVDDPGMHAQQTHCEGLDPKSPGKLVYGDGARRIECGVEKIVPAGRHAADRGCVEDLDRRSHAPAVREAGDGGRAKKRRARPSGLVFRRTPEREPQSLPYGTFRKWH